MAETNESPHDSSDGVTPKKKRVRISHEPLTAEEHAEAQRVFLAEYGKYGNVTDGCKKAGISRTTVYRWQEHDETFGLQFNQAKETYCDSLRHEIHRRAHTGVSKPIYQGGKRVGYVREFSDTLLIFEAKARMPEYRDKLQVEQSGQVSVSHDFGDDPDTAALARDLLSRLSSGASDASGVGASSE